MESLVWCWGMDPRKNKGGPFDTVQRDPNSHFLTCLWLAYVFVCLLDRRSYRIFSFLSMFSHIKLLFQHLPILNMHRLPLFGGLPLNTHTRMNE